MTDLTTLTDPELDAHTGAAVLDGNTVRLTALETERDRRRRTADHQTLADAEAQRRSHAAAEAERDRLRTTLIRQCEEFRAGFVAALHRLDVTPPVDAGPLVAEAYTLGRQAYALGHDLAGAVGDRRLALNYDVTDQLELHGGVVGKAFVMSLLGRTPTVPTPWKDNITRLRALMPQVERIGNGG